MYSGFWRNTEGLYRNDAAIRCGRANEIFDPSGAGKARAEEEILAGVSRLAHQARNLVLVTNEIFSDGYRYEEETMEYQRILGNINVRLAEMADCVTEVVYGIPVRIKKE